MVRDNVVVTVVNVLVVGIKLMENETSLLKDEVVAADEEANESLVVTDEVCFVIGRLLVFSV